MSYVSCPSKHKKIMDRFESVKYFLVFLVLFSLGTLTMYVVLNSQPKDLVDFDNPVRDASRDEVTNLPGLSQSINFKHYSGYLKAEVFQFAPNYLHYWFVESQDKPSSDPVLLWLNGGPGCSSLIGSLYEHGPFHIKGDTKELELNEYSWNKRANVLYLESPAEVGFSYCPIKNETLMHTDDITANENYQALKSFMEKFPQFKKNKLYLAGQSYAGVYLPTLGVLVDADPELNLHGIAIGNGALDYEKLGESLVFFAYYHGLVGKTVWRKVSDECCNSKPPAREYCTFRGPSVSIDCDSTLNRIHNAIFGSGINPYGLYNDCENSSNERKLTKRSENSNTYAKELFSHIFRPTGDRERNATTVSSGVYHNAVCINHAKIIRYLNDQDVRIALHIPNDVKKWVVCTEFYYRKQYPNRPSGLAPQIKQLINSKRNLTLLVYNGDTDMICNFLGNEWFVDDLGRELVRDFAPWKVAGQVGGYFKVYDGIVFATVKGAGHRVPADRPREAAKMIQSFLNAKGYNIQF